MFKRTSLLALIIGCLAFSTIPVAEVEAAGYKKSYSSHSARSRTPYTARKRYSRPTSTYKRPVIQKNYYQNPPRSYGRSSPGLGTSILGGAAGAVGGMMLYNALSGPSSGDKALQMQKEERIIQDAKEEQARDDKLERIEQKLDAQQAPALIPPQEPFYQLGGQH